MFGIGCLGMIVCTSAAESSPLYGIHILIKTQDAVNPVIRRTRAEIETIMTQSPAQFVNGRFSVVEFSEDDILQFTVNRLS